MKILFFSPFAAISKHSRAEYDLGLNLIASQNEVFFFRCDYDLKSYCSAMTAFGLSYNSTRDQKDEICRRCRRESVFGEEVFAFPTIYSSSIEVFSSIYTNLANNVSYDNWQDFNYMGIQIGKFAAYEFILEHKLIGKRIPEHLICEYRSILANAIYLTKVAFEFFSTSNFDRVVVYNRNYSSNRIFCQVAELFGITTYSLQAAGPSNDVYGYFSLERDPLFWSNVHLSEKWKVFSELPLDQKEVHFVKQHLQGLFQSANFWVYSKPILKISKRSLRELLGISESMKVVLLATSSADELNAIQLSGLLEGRTIDKELEIFKNQEDWIQSVVKFIESEPNVFLIIRIHPREFGNAREGLNSENGMLLKKFVEGLKSRRIYLNLPEDNLSLYNFIPITDLLLTGFSTVGFEFAAFNIPVITHEISNLGGFPDDLVSKPKNREEYFNWIGDKLVTSSHAPTDFLAYRWFNFRFSVVARPLSPIQNHPVFIIIDFVRRVNARAGQKSIRIMTSVLLKLLSLKKSHRTSFSDALIRGFDGISSLHLEKKNHSTPIIERSLVNQSIADLLQIIDQ